MYIYYMNIHYMYICYMHIYYALFTFPDRQIYSTLFATRCYLYFPSAQSVRKSFSNKVHDACAISGGRQNPP